MNEQPSITTPGQALARAICPTGYETLYPLQKEAYDAWAQAVIDSQQERHEKAGAPSVDDLQKRYLSVTQGYWLEEWPKTALGLHLEAISAIRSKMMEWFTESLNDYAKNNRCAICGSKKEAEPSKLSVEVPTEQEMVRDFFDHTGDGHPDFVGLRSAITTPYERKLEELRERIRIFGHNQKVSDAEHAKALTALRDEVSTWKSHTESVEKKLEQFSRFTPEDCSELMDVLHGATGRGCVTSARELVAKVEAFQKQFASMESLIAATGLTETEGSLLGQVSSICDLAVARVKDCNQLRAENEHLKPLEGYYAKVVSVALDCDPMPAWRREDNQLEPPWEVFERIKNERDELSKKIQKANLDAVEEVDDCPKCKGTGVYTKGLVKGNVLPCLKCQGTGTFATVRPPTESEKQDSLERYDQGVKVAQQIIGLQEDVSKLRAQITFLKNSITLLTSERDSLADKLQDEYAAHESTKLILTYWKATKPNVSPWVACSERMPTREDADKHQEVFACYPDGRARETVWNGSAIRLAIAWMPIPPLPSSDEKAKEPVFVVEKYVVESDGSMRVEVPDAAPIFVPFSTIPINGRFEMSGEKWTKTTTDHAIPDGKKFERVVTATAQVIALPDEKPTDRWAKEKAAFAEGKRVQARWTDWKVRGNDGEDAWWNMTTPPNWDTLGSIEYRVHPDDLTPLKWQAEREAFKAGTVIQARSKDCGDWLPWDDCSDPFWLTDPSVEYRIKPTDPAPNDVAWVPKFAVGQKVNVKGLKGQWVVYDYDTGIRPYLVESALDGSAAMHGFTESDLTPYIRTLPAPPEGQQYHKPEAITEEMWKDGWRPLLVGEMLQAGDERLRGQEWENCQTNGGLLVEAKGYYMAFRTKRGIPKMIVPMTAEDKLNAIERILREPKSE